MLSFTGKKEDTNGEFGLIEDGDYEVTLKADYKQTKDKKTYINCVFAIRKDVDQKYGGRLVFEGIYKNESGEYPSSKINAILSAIPNARLDFSSEDDLLQYLNGKEMIVTVKTKDGGGTYKDRNVIAYNSYRQTEHPVAPVAKGLEVAPDDLPF